jgi:hypothetical protein
MTTTRTSILGVLASAVWSTVGACSDDVDEAAYGSTDGSSSSVSATGTEATSEPTGGPTTAGSMSASGSETDTASSTTTSGGACEMSAECIDPASPICVDMACVPCSDDAECLAKGPGAPACSDEGRCVACTPSNAGACEGVTPICNAVNECEGCDFHEQCPASACRIETGGCFDEAEVYDVGAGQTYASIEAAVADLGEGGEVVLRIHDGASYDEAVTIAGAGTAYALLADDDEMVPQWVNTMDAAPTLRVEDGAEVYVQSLRVTGNLNGANPGITADGATLYLDRTQVVGNTGGGILLSNAAAGHIRNCFVGGDVSDVSAVEAVGASVDILYSTLAAGFGNAAGLRCSGTGMVHVRNSLVVARTDDPAVACTTDSFATSLTEDDLGDMNTNWFAGFGTGNFSLTGMAPPDVLTTAQWQAGDPLVDIDGEPRPTEAGTADVAGADVP